MRWSARFRFPYSEWRYLRKAAGYLSYGLSWRHETERTQIRFPHSTFGTSAEPRRIRLSLGPQARANRRHDDRGGRSGTGTAHIRPVRQGGAPGGKPGIPDAYRRGERQKAFGIEHRHRGGQFGHRDERTRRAAPHRFEFAHGHRRTPAFGHYPSGHFGFLEPRPGSGELRELRVRHRVGRSDALLRRGLRRGRSRPRK